MRDKIAKWMIFFSYILLVALNQLLWINFVTISDVVSKIYNIDTFFVGLLAIVFPIVYVIVSIPSGIFIDRRGYKLSLLIGAIVMTIFTVIRDLQQSYTFLFIGQLGIAFAQPFINNSVSKLANEEFPENKVPLIIGLGSLAIFIGVGAGMALPSIMLSYMGFSSMMLWITVSSIIILIIFLISLLLSGMKENLKREERVGFRHLLGLRELLIFSMVTFVGMGVFNGILTWIQPMLSHLNISDIDVGIDGLMFVFGGMVGSIVIPWLVTVYGKRRIFILIAFFISVPILFLIPFIGNFVAMVAVTTILGFFMLGSFPVLIDWGTIVSGISLAGSATSFLWFMGQIGGFIIPLLMGVLGPISPDNTYLYAMLLSGILFVILVPFILRVKETQKMNSPGSVSQ
ncbi:MAG: MFS transporter [Thermoplasmata archaeon]|jgi:fucose permease|nr:MFS transporter [Thermoplasmata archaeon]MVT15114.1 MFS transporter [Euryarchaeota archaeon]